jgi:hypothetical protein
MVEKFKQQLDEILASFDAIRLDDEYKRRLAVKPLYDYFQRTLLEVGNQLCGFYRNSLKSCHLKARWIVVKGALEIIEDASRWDKLVRTIHNERMSSEHNDYSSPSKQSLIDVRNQAPEFANWVLDTGQKYHEQSEGFTFVQEFRASSRWYTGQAERIISELGEDSPFCIKEDFNLVGGENSYKRLVALNDAVGSRSLAVRSLDELTKEDLSNLVDLVRIVERVDASENFVLSESKCPRCGGNITGTQKSVGGSEEEEPYAIFYRIGCDKCDYELDTETVDL